MAGQLTMFGYYNGLWLVLLGLSVLYGNLANNTESFSGKCP